ncbi:MAG: C39 family peptidase [Planctomycetota bacterium]|nr:C39 family peptidase [Planctomycetota bacterium]
MLALVLSFAPLVSGPGSVVAVPQDPAPQKWEHQLVLHESFEDFYAGGMSAAYRAELDALAPVRLTAGHRPGSGEQIDAIWNAAQPASSEWLDGFYESAEILVPGGFDEVLPSWNVNVPAGCGMCFELRVRADGKAPWSPWLYVGEWGNPTPPTVYLRRDDPGGPRADNSAPPTVECEAGRIEVDFFVGAQRHKRLQYRVRVTNAQPAEAKFIELKRVALCTSRRVDGPPEPGQPDKARALEVPFRSQRTEKPEIAGRICSPTSLAMLLAFRGVERPTLEVAQRAFDARHDIYGNWTRNVQAAWSFGVPGHLARFADWKGVAAELERGQPLVISIAAKAGELAGAPYASTAGHLLVVTGFDGKGGVLVNDPAVEDAATGKRVYRADDLAKVWLARGGTAYVLRPRPAEGAQTPGR